MSVETIQDYCAPNKRVHIYKPETHAERMLRLYCTQHKEVWNLQVRGPLGVGFNGHKDGQSSVIAGCYLNREQLTELRDTINGFLADA